MITLRIRPSTPLRSALLGAVLLAAALGTTQAVPADPALSAPARRPAAPPSVPAATEVPASRDMLAGARAGRSAAGVTRSAGGVTRSAGGVTRSAGGVTLTNGGFETGDFTGWQLDQADAAVIATNPPGPCFDPPERPGTPEQCALSPDDPMRSKVNCFMACLSTGSFFGGDAAGGMRSDLTTSEIVFDRRADRITVSFTVDFQTEEPLQSIAHNDAFEARLVTKVGSFPIIQIDSIGRTPAGRGLRVEGFNGLVATAEECPLVGLRTRRLKVTWKREFDQFLKLQIDIGPVYVEFSVSDQGNPALTSIACVDDLEVKVGRN